MLRIEEIISMCKDETIILTNHVNERMKERDIKYEDLIIAILNGKIIEQYEDDKPYPSCLIMGYTSDNKPLHIIAGVESGMIWLITSYYPTIIKWEDDFITRKR